MIKLPKPILHIRLPYDLSKEEELIYRKSLQDCAKDYLVLLTFSSESGRVEMEIHWILPKELNEEKANEIIESINELR